MPFHFAQKLLRSRPKSPLIAFIPLALLGLAACQDAALPTGPPQALAARAIGRSKLDTILVTPGTASVVSGSSLQLTATPLDASGNTMSTNVGWSSANTGVATVNSGGLVTGVAAGMTNVTASAGGKSTTVPITITATSGSGGTGGSTAAECATPKAGWIFCDDFETDRMSKYFEADQSNGNFTRTASVGVGSSMGMRAHFAQGAVGAGSLHLAFGRTPSSYMRPVDAGTANYREIYWRVYVRNQAGWQGGGGDKLSRAQSMGNANWGQAMVAHVWSGGSSPSWNYLVIDPASGTDSSGTLKTTTYNDWNNFRWLGGAYGTTPLFDSAHTGQWHCVEAHVRLNDAGQSNGTFDLWVDGNADASRSGLNWVGSFSDYGINTVFLENYWNAGSPVAQDRFLDKFVVSTTRIGC